MKRFWIWGDIAFAFAFALAAIAESGCTRGERIRPLRIQISSEPPALTPSQVEDGVGLKILSQIQEGLYSFDSRGELRSRWVDQKEWSTHSLRGCYRLKSHLRWSDGVPLRAEHVKYGILKSLNATGRSKLAGSLFVIRGAKDYYLGKKKASDVAVWVEEASRSALDSGEALCFELEHPVADFDELLTLPVSFPQREDLQNQPPQGPWVTSGPYFLERWVPEQKIVLKKNPHRTDFDARAPRDVEWVVVQDETTALHLFEKGELDLLTKLPLADLPSLRSKQALREDPFFATYYLGMNFKKKPFDRIEMRKKLTEAVNPVEILKILGGGERLAQYWIPYGMAGYLEPQLIRSRLNAQVGLQRDEVLKKVDPTEWVAGFDLGQRNSLIMEKIQQDVRTRWGWRLKLQATDWKTHLSLLKSDPPAIFRMGILSPLKDPIQMLQIFVTGDPNNYLGWSDARVDRWVREAERLPSGKKREELIHQIQIRIVDELAWVIPIYHYVQHHAVGPRIQNFSVNPMGLISLQELQACASGSCP